MISIHKKRINKAMPKEIFPSTYECDCGYLCYFFENTINEMKLMSEKKKTFLLDSGEPAHTIVFDKGQMVNIVCPKRNHKGTKGSSVDTSEM